MNNFNEQEITKRMLNEIRNHNINENAYEEEELTSSELSEEQTNFRNTVSPRVEFTGFKIYPKNRNVVFSGKFDNLGGLEWQFTLEDANGLYITANNVPFSEDTINTIKKLKGYYDNWADEWAKKLATEYNRSDNISADSEVQKSEVI